LNESQLKQAQNYSFRASGTNVTLKQLIVVNGRLTREAPGGAATARALVPETRRGAPAQRPAAPAATPPAALAAYGDRTHALTNSSLVLEGTVRIGATNLQRVKAVSQPR
jgi:hypothetical protein